MLSQQYTDDKSIRISASAEEIAGLVSDFNQWPDGNLGKQLTQVLNL